MKPLTDGVSLDGFFEEVGRGERPVLLLDYDGTLAPFREDRDNAVPYPGVSERLDRIRAVGETRLVLISGRPVADVKRLVALDHPVEIWGTHGWEHLTPDGTYHGPELSPNLRKLFEDASRVIVEDLGAPERCERKPATVAFHVRDLPIDRAEEELKFVRDRWEALLDGEAVSIEPFDGGLELRLTGRDKGVAVESILEDVSPDEPVVYLGDDLTDEDAFEALQGRGLRILVRNEFRETKADLWLVPPDELLSFLDRWIEVRTT